MDEKHDIRQELAIILPSLDPDKKLCGVIDGLIAEGFEHIVIVDDGSDAAHQAPFEYAAGFPQCHILRHEVNKGKGRGKGESSPRESSRATPSRGRPTHRELMPSAIAFQSSVTFPRNATMAMIAMTTSTPTKMAYSVVPCPFSSRRNARSLPVFTQLTKHV